MGGDLKLGINFSSKTDYLLDEIDTAEEETVSLGTFGVEVERGFAKKDIFSKNNWQLTIRPFLNGRISYGSRTINTEYEEPDQLNAMEWLSGLEQGDSYTYIINQRWQAAELAGNIGADVQAETSRAYFGAGPLLGVKGYGAGFTLKQTIEDETRIFGGNYGLGSKLTAGLRGVAGLKLGSSWMIEATLEAQGGLTPADWGRGAHVQGALRVGKAFEKQ